MRRYVLVFLLLFRLLTASGQNEVIDSLSAVLGKDLPDSARVYTLLELSAQYYRTDQAQARKLAIQARDLAEKSDFKAGLPKAHKAVGMTYYYQSNTVEALVNWKLALEAFRANNDQNGVSNILNNIGAVYFAGGDDKSALDYYLQSLRVAEEHKDSLRTVTALQNIGTVYLTKDATKPMALPYYRRALPLSQALGDQDAIGTCAVNMGEIFLQPDSIMGSMKVFNPDSALFYFEMALEAYRHSTTGNLPVALKNIGKVYAIRKDYDMAIQYQTEAYRIAFASDAKLEMAQCALSLADTYQQKGDIDQAIARYNEAKAIASELDAHYEMHDAYSGLAKSYAQRSDFQQAYTYLNLFSDLRDSLYNADMDKKLQSQSLSYEIDKKEGQISLLEKDQELKELELKRQKAIKNGTIAIGVLFLLLAGGMFNRYRYTRKVNKIIETEKQRSENLLLNILPHETAEELKAKGTATPKHYDQVSVLFTDFKGFTAMSELVSPQQLVHDLHECFSFFDRICEKHGLEKIKTIGDAYMAAGGLPAENSTHAADAIQVALAMRDFVAEGKARKIAAGMPFFEIRIGIHTGPVVSGIVGVKKFAYDIWGDTVNTASRMESSGSPGHVNISEATYALVKDEPGLVFTPRGKVQAKGKGEMEMYFVEPVAELV